MLPITVYQWGDTKLLSPKEFLRAELEMGISFDNDSFVRLTEKTAEQIKGLGVESVLDFGAGTGVYAESFRKAGYDTYAFEIWDEHKEYIRENAPQVKIVSSPITTDLMNFIEVAEHMTDKELNHLFKIIRPKYVLFSSTSEKKEWDEVWGHINIKSQIEWIDFFYDNGYKLVTELSYPTNYTKLFFNES